MARFLACLSLLAALVLASPAAAKEPPAAYKKESKRAIGLYAKESYKDAALAFRKALAVIKDGGFREAEIETRKYLVLALYGSGQKDEAVNEFRALKTLAPSFAFDPDEVLPETMEFFAKRQAELGPQKPEPAKPDAPTADPTPPANGTTDPIVVNPDAPRDIKPAADAEVTQEKRWRWYYLAPLGIGQFLAGSPVRGAILLVLEAGFAALNIVGYVLYSREFIYGDTTARDATAATTGQTLMNVGFFGIIGSVVLGVIDGAALEP